MDLNFSDNGEYCSIGFESDLDSDKYMLRKIYFEFMGKSENEQRELLSRLL